MVDKGARSEREESRGTRIRVMGTSPDSPEEGRTFVWTKMGWFERLEGPSGDVAFTPIAGPEVELRELVSQDDAAADLHELSGEDREVVSEEFLEQSRPDSDSSEDSTEASDEDDQANHQHD
jgi:hypothetical protein